MKRIWLIVALLSALLLGATPVLAQDGFYVIAGGGSVGTKITSLPYEINSSGLYCLARNLTYSGTTGNAITVNVSDVTLDLMGFKLSGPGKTSGSSNLIYIASGVSDVEIRNGSVTDAGGYGIYGPSPYGVRVIGLRVRDVGSAVQLLGYNHLVMGCTVLNSAQGIFIWQGLIKGNQVYNIGGIGLNTNNGSTVSGNVVKSCGTDGIGAGAGSSVLDNTVMDNDGYGILTGYGVTVKGNTCRGNTKEGIKTGNDCLITNNCTQGLTVGSNCYAVYNRTY